MSGGGDKKQESIDLSRLGIAHPPSLSEEDMAGLVNALKNKIEILAPDVLESLSPAVRKCINVRGSPTTKHNGFLVSSSWKTTVKYYRSTFLTVVEVKSRTSSFETKNTCKVAGQQKKQMCIALGFWCLK